MRGLTKSRLDREFARIEQATAASRLKKKLTKRERNFAESMLDTVRRYVSDARYFTKNGDVVSAFGALNYAFGWLDAAASFGLLERHAPEKLK